MIGYVVARGKPALYLEPGFTFFGPIEGAVLFTRKEDAELVRSRLDPVWVAQCSVAEHEFDEEDPVERLRVVREVE